MIRYIYYILLLLSLSYSQPDTEWTQVNIPSNQNIVKLISDGNGLYGATSTASIYFSSDNGLNWESLPLHPDIFPYGVDLFDKVDDFLFFNQNIGGSTYNYRKYYNGENWEDWEILPYDESIIYEFVHYDNTIYALLNQGISISFDYGTSWELIDMPSIIGYIHLQYVDDQYLYINHGCILYRYNIETFEWVDITGILDDIGPPEPYSCTSIHQIEKFNNKLLISMYWYGGVGTLFYSQNNGDSWEIINSFPSLSSSGYGTNNVPAVATKNGILYAGTATSEDGIYYTQNLIDWTEYSAGLSNYNLSVSALAATEENIYKLGGSVNLFQNELIGVSGDIYGCIDHEACNYDETATADDGSCEYTSCDGTLLVPYEYSTIQAAIDDAVEGDSVLVSAGTYLENVNFNGKNIAVIGEDRETTIIDGGHNGSVVTFDSIEGTAAALSNFTITGGNAYDGGGIYCSSSAPTIKDNIITGNVSETYGGGISCNYSSPIIMNNTITSNSAIYGGGISFDRYTSSVIKGNNINGNSAEEGGGIGCFTFSSPTITNNTIVGNSASTNGGGIYCYYVSAPSVTNTIIWDNTAPTDPNISVYFSDPFFNYCDVMGSWEGGGNIDAVPQFTTPENGDYTLQEGSPCIDAGTADLDGDGLEDITDYYGFSPDMGAFEYEGENECDLGDVNCDDFLDVLDFVIMINLILANEYDIIADMNEDGQLDILDVVILVNLVLNPQVSIQINSGTSYGECWGYCVFELALDNSNALFTASSWGSWYDEFLDLLLEDNLSQESWQQLVGLIDFEYFQSLDDVYGCPDCSDGGAEFIEILYDGVAKQVTFDAYTEIDGIQELTILLRDLRADYWNHINGNQECYIIPEVGPCDGVCTTYFFNQDSNECEEFIFGCCGPEAFDTMQDCIDSCE